MFHSEADFQHALAWAIRERHPNMKVRLEYAVTLDGKRGHVDIRLDDADGPKVVELKYWTRELDLIVDDEEYRLREHGREPLARYDLWRDIARIERLIDDKLVGGGHIVALTNVQGYWNAGRPGTIDEGLRIHEGHVVHGSLSLSPKAKPGTTKGREKPIELRGSYVTRWRPYSQPAEVPGGEFRYLLLDVGAGLRAS